MKAQSLAAIVLSALLASGVVAQDEMSPDEQLLELKRELVLLWAEMASDPTSVRRTPEWRAVRSEYVELRNGLRDLEALAGDPAASAGTGGALTSSIDKKHAAYL